MSAPKPDKVNDRRLAILMADCEEARSRLDRATRVGARKQVIAELVERRVACLEALAEHLKLVPPSDTAFVPPASDRSRRKTRNPAA